MAQNDTDGTRGEQVTHPDTPIPLGSLGDAEVQIDVDEQTYQRLHDELTFDTQRNPVDQFSVCRLSEILCEIKKF